MNYVYVAKNSNKKFIKILKLILKKEDVNIKENGISAILVPIMVTNGCRINDEPILFLQDLLMTFTLVYPNHDLND